MKVFVRGENIFLPTPSHMHMNTHTHTYENRVFQWYIDTIKISDQWNLYKIYFKDLKNLPITHDLQVVYEKYN